MNSSNASAHHVGCAVENIAEACAFYASSFGLLKRTRKFEIASQGVDVCFLEMHDSFYLELVTPHSGNTKLKRYLDVGVYHLCFLVDDLRQASDKLASQKFFCLPAFESQAFDGHLCQFFLSPQKHLFELAQMSPEHFRTFFQANLAQ